MAGYLGSKISLTQIDGYTRDEADQAIADNATPTGVSGKDNTATSYFDLPAGTTAQRPSNPNVGYVRFNTTLDQLEQYTSEGWQGISAPPVTSSVSPTTFNGESGTSFTVSGSNFDAAVTAQFITNGGQATPAASVTRTNSTELVITTPTDYAVADEPLTVKVINGSGLSASLDGAIDCGGVPSWSTNSGTIATIDDSYGSYSPITTLSATDPEGGAVTYAITSGAVPAGTTLDQNTGQISGDPTNVASQTTSTFTVNASDGINTTARTFSIIVNPVLDGSSSARANTSAASILALTNDTTDGLYWILPSGYGGSAFQVYCRMSSLGSEPGGYMMVMSYMGAVASATSNDHRTDTRLNRSAGQPPIPASSNTGVNSTDHRFLNQTQLTAIYNAGITKSLVYDRYRNVAVTTNDSQNLQSITNQLAWDSDSGRDTDRNTVVVHDPTNFASFLQNNTARWHWRPNGQAIRETWSSADANAINGIRGDVYTGNIGNNAWNEFYVK